MITWSHCKKQKRTLNVTFYKCLLKEICLFFPLSVGIRGSFHFLILSRVLRWRLWRRWEGGRHKGGFISHWSSVGRVQVYLRWGPEGHSRSGGIWLRPRNINYGLISKKNERDQSWEVKPVINPRGKQLRLDKQVKSLRESKIHLSNILMSAVFLVSEDNYSEGFIA